MLYAKQTKENWIRRKNVKSLVSVLFSTRNCDHEDAKSWQIYFKHNTICICSEMFVTCGSIVLSF